MESVKHFEEIIAKVNGWLNDSRYQNFVEKKTILSQHLLPCFQMKVTQAQISQNYSIAQQQSQLLECKLKESEEANSKLDSDLQVASLQIVSTFKILHSPEYDHYLSVYNPHRLTWKWNCKQQKK